MKPIDRSAPTFENQLWHASRILAEQGRDKLDNPHGMIGRSCGCGSCFCCAAAKIVKTFDEAQAQLKGKR